MSQELRESSAPVEGLVDSRRAAMILGVSQGTFKVWATRSRSATSGIAAAMPQPVGALHGQVYRLSDIEEFGRVIALAARGNRTDERSRGAYFTPDITAEFMAAWAFRDESDIVLEPSLGDGQFSLAVQRLARARGWREPALHGCELDIPTAKTAVDRGAVTSDCLHVGDFLAAWDLPAVDVVIGNPPFVRVRELPAPLRTAAHAAALRVLGEAMDPAGSAWMPFLAKAAHHVRPGGRLALVLPLDFTYVRYARPLWAFLARSYGSIKVLRSQQRLFSGILQNVLILFADDRGGSSNTVELIAVDSLAGLDPARLPQGAAIPMQEILAGDRAFQRALLTEETRETMRALAPYSCTASDRLKFNIGYVSGNKRFFHPGADAVAKYMLPGASLVPTIASSRQLSKQGLRTSEMAEESFLWLPGETLTASEETYVAHGEADGVDMAYKCRIRQPWFRVPGVKVPDLVLTTFSDPPKLFLNDAGWVASNSVLCGYMRTGDSAASLAASWYTPLTLLSTELEIHALGGGVMVAVPREADSVRVLTHAAAPELDLIGLSRALASSDRLAAYEVGAPAVVKLVGRQGSDALLAGAAKLASWRRAA